MTTLPADDQAVVRSAHLMLVLNLSDRALGAHIQRGPIPHPDARGHGHLKLWRPSTIRAWNPQIADLVDELLAHPAFGPRPQRYSNSPLLTDA